MAVAAVRAEAVKCEHCGAPVKGVTTCRWDAGNGDPPCADEEYAEGQRQLQRRDGRFLLTAIAVAICALFGAALILNSERPLFAVLILAFTIGVSWLLAFLFMRT